MQVHSASLPSLFSALLRYRDLITQLVVREFNIRYRGSILGILWAVITPILTVLVFAFVFGVVFQARWTTAPASNTDFVIIVLLGMLVHGILAEALGRAPTVIVGQAAFVKKVVFPLEVLPVVAVLHSLITATIGIAILLVVNALVNGQMPATMVLLPVVLLPYIVMLTGLVFFVSAFGVYVRDLSQIVSLVTMLTLFLAPIFYPISAVPPRYQYLLYINPLTFTVEQAREVALFGRAPNYAGLAIYSVIAVVVAWLGLIWFQRARRGFADVM